MTASVTAASHGAAALANACVLHVRHASRSPCTTRTSTAVSCRSQIADERLGQRLGRGTGRAQPAPQRLVLVAGDLLGRAEAAAAHDDEQAARHPRRRRVQPVQRRAQRRAEALIATVAVPPLLASPGMAILDHPGRTTAGQGDCPEMAAVP